MVNLSPTDVLAFDIDLHKVYCWSKKFGKVASAVPNVEAALQLYVDAGHGDEEVQLIAEVASPVSGVRAKVSSNAINFNLMKWAIFNIASAMALMVSCRNLLVAPSNVWTNGYPLKTRHQLAKCTAKNKDLRECEAMLWFYNQKPAAWVPFPRYLEAL